MSAPPDEPRPGILAQVKRAADHIDFAGARVLEIGGDRWDASAQYMIEQGASHVTIINIAPWWNEREELTSQITKLRADANHLSDHFTPGQFDAVFGIAVLEHIPKSWLMLEGIAQVLTRGGRAYLHGGPLWTAPKGHHLFTKVNDQFFRFVDEDCPIGDWEHLILDESGLAEQIEARGHDADTAAQLARWVHSTEGQNRYGYERLCRIFEDSPLDIVDRRDDSFKTPKPDVLKRIRSGPWGDESRFDVFSVTFVVQNGDVGPAPSRPRRFGFGPRLR